MTCPLCPFKGCDECQHQGGKDPTKMPTLSAPDDKLETQTKAAPAGNRGLTTTFRLRRYVMADPQSNRPRTMAEVIGPDYAAFLARVTGLPYTYVSTKLAEARARLDNEVPA